MNTKKITPLFGKLSETDENGKCLFDYINKFENEIAFPFYYEIFTDCNFEKITKLRFYNVSELIMYKPAFINTQFVMRYVNFLASNKMNSEISLQEIYALSILSDKDSENHPKTAVFRHAYLDDIKTKFLVSTSKRKFLEFIYSLDINELEFRRRVKDTLFNTEIETINQKNPYIETCDTFNTFKSPSLLYNELSNYNHKLKDLEINLLNLLYFPEGELHFFGSHFLLIKGDSKYTLNIEENENGFFKDEDSNECRNVFFKSKDGKEVSKIFNRYLKKRNRLLPDYYDNLDTQVNYVVDDFMKTNKKHHYEETTILSHTSVGYIAFVFKASKKTTSKLDMKTVFYNRNLSQIYLKKDLEIFTADRSFRNSFENKNEVFEKVVENTISNIFKKTRVISISKNYHRIKEMAYKECSLNQNTLCFPICQQHAYEQKLNELILQNKISDYLAELQMCFIINGSVEIKNFDEVSKMKQYISYKLTPFYEFELSDNFQQLHTKEFKNLVYELNSLKNNILDRKKHIKYLNKNNKSKKQSELIITKKNILSKRKKRVKTLEKNITNTKHYERDVIELNNEGELISTEDYCMVNYTTYVAKKEGKEILSFLKSRIFSTSKAANKITSYDYNDEYQKLADRGRKYYSYISDKYRISI